MNRDGRRFEQVLIARAKKRDDGMLELFAPRPGLWRGAPLAGDAIAPGGELGELEVLGVLHRLKAPDDAHGLVGDLPAGRRLARRPVDHATRLCTLDPSGTRAAATGSAESARMAASGPVFKTPLGGRYYARPAPGADPFVRPGDVLEGGETVALIEVMKTFNRVTYAGARARVLSIAKPDGDDVEAGDVLLILEALDG